MAERALLLALGGNCHSPVAVLCDFREGELFMRAALFSPAGQERVEGEARFAADDKEAPARLAADLLAKGKPGHFCRVCRFIGHFFDDLRHTTRTGTAIHAAKRP